MLTERLGCDWVRNRSKGIPRRFALAEMKNKLIARALAWKNAVHTGRSESDINVYLTALQDADVPQVVVDAVENALMPQEVEN